MLQTLFILVISLISVFLIVLILMQRGRGGGLAGAFGGMGGQSAFGAKAGDVFTRATVVVVGFWFILCIISILLLGAGSKSGGGLTDGLSEKSAQTSTAPETPALPQNLITPTPAAPSTPISTPTETPKP
ncbi:MAG: preprotein translocase subunit SecG [Planctomycetaceae bacterium]|jgi:preprotein translocase subunit SecG|nr:preprotein translocase subunit SecG [Planctomycetaceae bacterium]